jgi:hypothetical protein
MKGETPAMLNLLRHDEGLRSPQRSNLPVNVQHFRLQKGSAITSNSKSRHVKPLTLFEVLHLV